MEVVCGGGAVCHDHIDVRQLLYGELRPLGRNVAELGGAVTKVVADALP